MNRDEQIKNEVEKTINAMDKLQELEPNPYLFTRLEAEIKSSGKVKTSLLQGGILKPAALFLFILLNILSSFYIINSDTEISTYRQTYMSAISSEYNLNQTYNSQLGKLMGN